MSATCCVCQENVSEHDVACDLCNRQTHPTCAGLSRQEAECLRSKKRKIKFFCKNCDLIEVIHTLKEEICGLKNEIALLKTEGHNVSQTRVPEKLLSEDDILSEIEDRQRRANNILIYNMPESSADKEFRRRDDISKFVALVNAAAIEDEIDTDGCHRMGKNISDRPRPLLIRFKQYASVTKVLKKYKPKNNIFLNRDLTLRQRNASYLVRQEFRNRRTVGETNIRLVYHNGIPKIVATDVPQSQKNQRETSK